MELLLWLFVPAILPALIGLTNLSIEAAIIGSVLAYLGLPLYFFHPLAGVAAHLLACFVSLRIIANREKRRAMERDRQTAERRHRELVQAVKESRALPPT